MYPLDRTSSVAQIVTAHASAARVQPGEEGLGVAPRFSGALDADGRLSRS